MRIQFREYARSKLPYYRILFPENALEYNIDAKATKYTDLDRFERLIADLSHCVLIFPEGAGSYAELGLFSAIDKIAKITLIILDSNKQEDSFILLGPVARIGKKSDFNPHLLLNYQDRNPNFDVITTKLKNRRGANRRRFHDELKDWSDTSNYTKLAIVYTLIDLCRLNTPDSLLFMANALFSGQPGRHQILDFCNILLGSGFCSLVRDDQWIITKSDVGPFVNFDSEKNEVSIRGEINNLYLDYPDFSREIEGAFRC